MTPESTKPNTHSAPPTTKEDTTPRTPPHRDSNGTTPTPSFSPRRPLAHASSSGNLTDTPTKHSHTPSTTISPKDVKKWMETGTFGSEAPEDRVGNEGQEVEAGVVTKGDETADEEEEDGEAK
jgi:hypothetical protein